MKAISSQIPGCQGRIGGPPVIRREDNCGEEAGPRLSGGFLAKRGRALRQRQILWGFSCTGKLFRFTFFKLRRAIQSTELFERV